MIDVDEHGRPVPPIRGNEVDTLVGYLEYQRATFAWKTGGLDTDGLAATIASSSMTLGGLIKHLAFVEEWWFSYRLDGAELGSPWDAADFGTDPDWEWHSAANDAPDDLYGIWSDAVARSRESLARVLGHGGVDGLARRTGEDGHSPSVRWIVLHMIEEYARHNGHADLLRESIDGLYGE